MFLIIRFIQNVEYLFNDNAVTLRYYYHSLNAYNNTQLGEIFRALCKPILEPLKRLTSSNLQGIWIFSMSGLL